ncbi:MAG: hypothetical protein Kow0027_26190 [Saprospiraceae bacterium]
MKKYFYIIISVLVVTSVFGQSAPGVEGENIVPNPSFELYASPPIGWFYKGDHYTTVMKYWSSASNASPDVYGPRVRVPSHWAAKGFGKQTPHSGSTMSGITVYGCTEGKPHCREYIQIQLSEPLVVGQDYYCELWVAPLSKGLRVNNIGFHFSMEQYREITDGLLNLKPQLYADEVLATENGKWMRFGGRFKAEQEAEYLLIGNFFHDSLTTAVPALESSLPFGYYYIDDVMVKKVPPILPVPVYDDDLLRVKLEAGKVVALKDIYFEYDKWELMPRSYVELKKLLKIMTENPHMAIEVCGHTDNTGTDEYNLDLSEKRAKAVVEFLTNNGVSPSRTKYRGCGSNQPVASNATAAGRQLNRRVEFIILQVE